MVPAGRGCGGMLADVDVPGIDPARIPVHVAAVMDGNGRWAQRRGLKRTEGHAAGEEALMDAVEGALDLGVRWLTVYAFSTENWRRPQDEVRYLMGFNESLLVRRRRWRSRRRHRACTGSRCGTAPAVRTRRCGRTCT